MTLRVADLARVMEDIAPSRWAAEWDNVGLLVGDASKVIPIVLNGLNGPVTVKGQTFNNTMPPWKGTLSNKQISEVITYIRNAWGNKASTVTEAQVAAGGK